MYGYISSVKFNKPLIISEGSLILVYTDACLLIYDKRKYIAALTPKQKDLLKFWYFILDQKVLIKDS